MWDSCHHRHDREAETLVIMLGPSEETYPSLHNCPTQPHEIWKTIELGWSFYRTRKDIHLNTKQKFSGKGKIVLVNFSLRRNYVSYTLLKKMSVTPFKLRWHNSVNH